ncbi:MAG: hypothetical protein DWQ02_03990 [Bacteroidetes bacterium]|nr:MAG: hypothetical protein DWQ02_03990 [Bacteroidota bacterium]
MVLLFSTTILEGQTFFSTKNNKERALAIANWGKKLSVEYPETYEKLANFPWQNRDKLILLFADDIFQPHFGKSFSELSANNLKTISDFLDKIGASKKLGQYADWEYRMIYQFIDNRNYPEYRKKILWINEKRDKINNNLLALSKEDCQYRLCNSSLFSFFDNNRVKFCLFPSEKEVVSGFSEMCKALAKERETDRIKIKEIPPSIVLGKWKSIECEEKEIFQNELKNYLNKKGISVSDILSIGSRKINFLKQGQIYQIIGNTSGKYLTYSFIKVSNELFLLSDNKKEFKEFCLKKGLTFSNENDVIDYLRIVVNLTTNDKGRLRLISGMRSLEPFCTERVSNYLKKESSFNTPPSIRLIPNKNKYEVVGVVKHGHHYSELTFNIDNIGNIETISQKKIVFFTPYSFNEINISGGVALKQNKPLIKKYRASRQSTLDKAFEKAKECSKDLKEIGIAVEYKKTSIGDFGFEFGEKLKKLFLAYDEVCKVYYVDSKDIEKTKMWIFMDGIPLPLSNNVNIQWMEVDNDLKLDVDFMWFIHDYHDELKNKPELRKDRINRDIQLQNALKRKAKVKAEMKELDDKRREIEGRPPKNKN